MVYIDLNIVRAGGVNHPSEWPFSGYNEIPKRRRKHVPINDQRLGELAGFGSYQDLRINHRRWVEASLLNQGNGRDAKWTRSLAVGNRPLIDTIQKRMGLAAK
jgi:putative transposase